MKNKIKLDDQLYWILKVSLYDDAYKQDCFYRQTFLKLEVQIMKANFYDIFLEKITDPLWNSGILSLSEQLAGAMQK